MRLACDHAWLVYRTVRHPAWTVRYRRCRHCGQCSKSIQRGFTDQRNWFDRPIRLPDDLILTDGLRTIGASAEHDTGEGELL